MIKLNNYFIIKLKVYIRNRFLIIKFNNYFIIKLKVYIRNSIFNNYFRI